MSNHHDYINPFHRSVVELLTAMDAGFMTAARCYFGGGTRVVMELGEYRESRDIDFLCADAEGYRLLRETVTQESLRSVFAGQVKLAREVRSDQYGIRTAIEAADGTKVKFEVIREARIPLATSPGAALFGIAVPVLSHADAFAEKFLANADRGLDTSTNSRDIVDLAFMAQGWSTEAALAGWDAAVNAYGTTIDRHLVAVTNKMKADIAYRKNCFETLQVTNTKACMAGIELLASGKWRATKTRALRPTGR